MSKVLIFVSENTSKFKELENCLNNIKSVSAASQVDNISFLMIKPDGELHEIQSLDRNEIVIHKLKTAQEMIKNIIIYTCLSLKTSVLYKIMTQTFIDDKNKD